MSENDNNDKNEWLRQYDALAERFNKIYQAATERSREAMHAALDKAREELVAAKKFSAERGEELRKYLAKDMDIAVQVAQQLGETAKKKLDPGRLEAGALASLASILEQTGKALLNWGAKAREALICKTGEITSSGTLTCLHCGEKLHFEKTGHIPPCPKCKGTEFSKSY